MTLQYEASDRPTGWTDVLAACALILIGMGWAFSIFPADLLLGEKEWWNRLSGDDAVGLIGYTFFALDDWRYPLFQTTMLGPPDGVNIIFTDPVPVLALIGKIVHKLTGLMPNYLGSWLLLAYSLQGSVIFAILRNKGVERAEAFLGGIMALLVPAFLFRYGHIGLVAHFVILLAFLSYVRSTTVATGREMWLSGALVALVILVNPYLLLMSAGLYVAGIVEAGRRGRIGWLHSGLIVAGVSGGVVGFAGLLGLLDRGSTVTGGFGLYSMNLLSPVTPQLSALFGNDHFILDATQGQYEGYNYLGAGILLLATLAILINWRALPVMLWRNAILVAVVTGMAIYALSSEVYAGHALLFHLPYEAHEPFRALSTTFRSSGRLFWPAGYLVLIGAVLVLTRRLRPVWSLGLILSAVAAQAMDVRPLVESVHARAQPSPELFDLAAWAKALEQHDGLVIESEFLCTQPGNRAYIYPLQMMAANARLPSNSPIVNRGQRNCSAARAGLMRRLDANATTANPLIILFKSEVPAIITELAERQGFTCRDAGFAFACSRQKDSAAVLALGASPPPVTPLPLGTKLSVLGNGSGMPFLGSGWSLAGENFRWAETDSTTFVGRFPKPLCNGLSFRALIVPLAYGDYVVRTAHVRLNGQPVGDISVSGTTIQEVSVDVPLSGHCLEHALIELQFDNIRSPRTLGMNTDDRLLNWAFQWFEITAEE